MRSTPPTQTKSATFRLLLAKLLAVFVVIMAVIYIVIYILRPFDTFTQVDTSSYSVFDLPIDISLEQDNTNPGIDKAYTESDAHKQSLATANSSSSPSASTNSASQTGNFWEYPAIILPCTRSGDDALVLVNKSYQLPSAYAPSDLVAIENSGIRTTRSGMLVRSIMVTDLSELRTAASSAGIDLAVLSAYRSYSTQQSTYNYWVNYNNGSVSAADMVSARPGHSQHQLGTAVDFTTSEISDQLGQQFANTAAGSWLAQHAWEYGFALAYPLGAESITGYSYEPWHFRHIGRENAEEWHAGGLTLEEWLSGKELNI